MATSDSVYDIIVIGCGPAGIAAGIELKKCQSIPKFLILEARNRVGGRTYTNKHTFNNTQPIDLGARWIHYYNSENPLAAYHIPSDNDRIYHEIPHGSNTVILDTDGTPFSESLTEEAETVMADLYDTMKKCLLQEKDKSVSECIRDKYEKIHNEKLRRLVDLNLGYIEVNEASNLDQISAKSYGETRVESNVSDLELHNGFGSFIQDIVERNPLPIQSNTIITNIDIPSDKNEPIRLTTKDNRNYLTKYVLITIPLGCLKANVIQFNPSLPDWKRNAIEEMGFGTFNKVFLQFPSTFWDENFHGIFIASNTFRYFLCYPNDHMLTLLVVGHLAKKIEQQTDEETVEQILQVLKPIYPQIPKPSKYLITRWGLDPFSHGAYSYLKVGASNDTLKDLARECYDGRICWAGEHTNYDGTVGCVHNAFESGQREAKRLYGKLVQNLN